MRTLAAALALLLTACSSSAPPPPPMTSARERPERGSMIAALDLTLPVSWWHSSMAEPLNLTAEQFQRLDALTARQEDVAKLERDGMMAARELRTSFDISDAKAADIVAAGAHVRQLRDALLAAQLDLIAAQREILTLQQWQTLQRALSSERREQFDGGRGRGPGGGGRGRGPGGGGRRPWG